MLAQQESVGQTAESSMTMDRSLTQDELYRLTLFKWRYSLEASGFEHHEVEDLVFLKWLHASRRLRP